MGTDMAQNITIGFTDADGKLHEYKAESIEAVSFAGPDVPLPPSRELTLTFDKPNWWEWRKLYRWYKMRRQIARLMITEFTVRVVKAEDVK
jgi:hypothetical protein